MLKELLIITYQEIRSIIRTTYSWLTPLLFFVIVVCLFPIALTPDPSLLTQIAPGIIWITALLAVLISVGNIFQSDAQSGYLDLLLISHYSLTLLVFSKIFSHWLTHCVPLILMSPVLGLLLNLHTHEISILILSLLLGTPVLSLLGGMGAALVIGIHGNSILLPILIMPLYIPVMIFGTESIIAANLGQPMSEYIAIMGALLLISLAFAPLLCGIALRIGVNQ